MFFATLRPPFRVGILASPLLLAMEVSACGGRASISEIDAFSNGGHTGIPSSASGSVASAGTTAPSGAAGSGGERAWNSKGSASSVPEPVGVCGDGSCDLSETSGECDVDCWGDCGNPADISAWVDNGIFLASGYAGVNHVPLSCDPVDGAELAFSVVFPSSGILSVSTISNLTNFDTVLAIRAGSCSGLEIDCSNGSGVDARSHVEAWLDANERGIILLEAVQGPVDQLGLTLSFNRDNFDYDWSESMPGTLAGCEATAQDIYGIELVEGEGVQVRVDTTSASSAADFNMLITNLTVGNSAGTDDDFRCTFPPPSARCPAMTFEAASTGTYLFTVGLGSNSCGSVPPAYDLTVLRQQRPVDLRLLIDG